MLEVFHNFLGKSWDLYLWPLYQLANSFQSIFFFKMKLSQNKQKTLSQSTRSDTVSRIFHKLIIKNIGLLVGPFKNFNALKTTYISLNNLGFENLNIYKE